MSESFTIIKYLIDGQNEEDVEEDKINSKAKDSLKKKTTSSTQNDSNLIELSEHKSPHKRSENNSKNKFDIIEEDEELNLSPEKKLESIKKKKGSIDHKSDDINGESD